MPTPPARHRERDSLPSPSSGQSIRLPRSSSGYEPQYLLLTLLGDYWFRRSEPLPSAGLIRLLALFDVPDFAVRQALRRLAHRGLLVVTHAGRTANYGLPARTETVIQQRLDGVLHYARESPVWNGDWTIVSFSVPSADKAVRNPLRSRLRALGFAPLHDAVWVSPSASPRIAADLLDELGVTDGFAFTSREHPRRGSHRRIGEIFDLEDLADHFVTFADRYEGMETTSLDDDAALMARTRLMTDWMALRSEDPDLPIELLPPDWPRARARAAFVAAYDDLAIKATAAFKSVIATVDPELAELAAPHRAG